MGTKANQLLRASGEETRIPARDGNESELPHWWSVRIGSQLTLPEPSIILMNDGRALVRLGVQLKISSNFVQ